MIGVSIPLLIPVGGIGVADEIGIAKSGRGVQ